MSSKKKCREMVKGVIGTLALSLFLIFWGSDIWAWGKHKLLVNKYGQEDAQYIEKLETVADFYEAMGAPPEPG